jgi:hypothetical protein
MILEKLMALPITKKKKNLRHTCSILANIYCEAVNNFDFDVE